MKTAFEEARRIAGGIARQRQDVVVRAAALARLRPVDVVQVVGGDGRLYPPTMLWEVEDGPVCVLADWTREPTAEGGWQYHERRFTAEGFEIGGDRVLVVPSLTPQQAHETREAQFSRWTRALVERERAYDAALPEWLQTLIRCDWMKEATAMDIERRAAEEIMAHIPKGAPNAE